MARAKLLYPGAMEEAGPEHALRHSFQRPPIHSGSDSCANQAARAGAGNECGSAAVLGQRFHYTDVCDPTNRTTAQGQSNAAGLKMTKPGHPVQLYGTESSSTAVSDLAARIQALADVAEGIKGPAVSAEASQRNRWTRSVDRTTAWLRDHLPAVHWIGAFVFAFVLFIYCRLLGVTVRLVTPGNRPWPDLPAPSILAIWHGSAPSLLSAIVRRRPNVPLVIMVAQDPRGDSLALLCRLLKVEVIRGDGGHGGWEALVHLSAKVERGACAILTPDGGGPARWAKPGALVLSAVTGTPLVAVGAACKPSVSEPRKWDSAQNPLPFGRIAVVLSEPLNILLEHDAASFESCRRRLQRELDQAAAVATQALN